jgi:hypothetical protein
MGHPSDPVRRGRPQGAHRAQPRREALQPQPPDLREPRQASPALPGGTRRRRRKAADGAAAEESGRGRLTRRKLLVSAGGVTAGLIGLDRLDHLARQPLRVRQEAFKASALPDIQFDVGSFLASPVTLNDGGGSVTAQFPPVFTGFATVKLGGAPNSSDQQALSTALAQIEQAYPFSPSGVFTFVAYGLPYFRRFSSSLFSDRVPRLASDTTRFALEEAVPSPTDVSTANPGISKVNFNVPVQIESNDMVFEIRSDRTGHIKDVLNFLGGSNRLRGKSVASPSFSVPFRYTSTRIQFLQVGMPRKVANQAGLTYRGQINPDSPMWMGFLDQQTNGSAPSGDVVTFAGTSHAHLTTANPGDYFDNGAILHLSHNIEDLAQFYSKKASAVDPDGPEPFTERCQYMFRSDPIPSAGNTNQYHEGGGPAYLANVFKGTHDAVRNAKAINTFNGEHRIGHLSALQRSSRASDGTPLHIRNDGPGFDSMDVPGGSKQPKLQFAVFVPTADFFQAMRVNQASLDLVKRFGVAPSDNGLERFLTATRRQNFLVPPRRNRAFPFAELSGPTR